MYKHITFKDREVVRGVKPTYGNVGSLLIKFSLFILNYLGKRTKRHYLVGLGRIGKYLSQALVNEGMTVMINKMKVSVIAIQKYIAGTPLQDTRLLGPAVALSNGLPSFLSKELRSEIRQGNLDTIRLVFSVLSMYRGFVGEYGDPSYESITAEPSESDFRSLHEWCSAFTDQNIHIKNTSYIRLFGERSATIEYIPIFSSSPNHSLSYSGILRDAQLWKKLGLRGVMWEYLDSIKHLDKSVTRVLNDFLILSEYRAVSYDRSLPLPPRTKSGRKKERETSTRPHGLGRISLKYEPAGKIRPFAIVDYWTQIVLKPLHATIMKLLVDYFSPMDGTFDQNAATSSFALEGHKNIYSFDLSKATDMIPVRAYESILSVFVTRRMAKSWVRLMTERDFLTTEKGVVTDAVRYTRGQPMGAYSSWAMLALFHHLVVQYSWYRISGKMSMFTSYRVLGDDIVIGDTAVANSYLEVMKEFGVPISLPKSFISEGGRRFQGGKVYGPLFNFANQIWIGKENISPMPYSEYLNASAEGLPALKEMAFRAIRYGWDKSFENRVRLLTWNASEWKRIQMILRKGGHISDLFALKLLAYCYQPGSEIFGNKEISTPKPGEVPSCEPVLIALATRKVGLLKGSVGVTKDLSKIESLALSWGNKVFNNLSHLRAKALLWTGDSHRMNFCVDLAKELIPSRGWVGYKGDVSDLTAQLNSFYDIQSDVWTTLMNPVRLRFAGSANLVLNNWIGSRNHADLRVAQLSALLQFNRSSNPPKRLKSLKDVELYVGGQVKYKRLVPRAWSTGRFLLKESGFVLPKLQNHLNSRRKLLGEKTTNRRKNRK